MNVKYKFYTHKEMTKLFSIDKAGDFWETKEKFVDWINSDNVATAAYITSNYPFGEVVDKKEIDRITPGSESIMWAIKETFTKEEYPEYFL